MVGCTTIVEGANDFAWQALMQRAKRLEDEEKRVKFPKKRIAVEKNNDDDADDDNFVACAAPELEVSSEDFLRAEVEELKKQLAEAKRTHEVAMENLRVVYNRLTIEHRAAISERDELKEKLERERVQRDKYWRARLEQEETRTHDALQALELQKAAQAKIADSEKK